MKSRLYTLALLLALATAPAFGQGCAMCYTSAKGAGASGQRAITRAVLVLLLPTLTIIGGLVGVSYTYSRKRDREKQ